MTCCLENIQTWHSCSCCQRHCLGCQSEVPLAETQGKCRVTTKTSSSEILMTKSVPVNFQSVSRSKAVTQRNQVSRQKMNVNTAHICLCVASADTNRLLNQGKHKRCQCQPQMVTGPIMTWLAFLNLKCHLCWGTVLSVKAQRE